MQSTVFYPYHKPVLQGETIEFLKIKKGGTYLDATIGGAGYAVKILEKGGRVIGIDADQESIAYLKNNFAKYFDSGNLKVVNINYGNLGSVLRESGIGKVQGIIFDLGLSSYQIDKSGRGFSFLKKEKLDMRFDKSQEITAWDIVNKYSKDEIYEIFSKNSEELNSRAISQAVVRARALKNIDYTSDLNEVIRGVLETKSEADKNKTLARIYQAIRIEVNSELSNLIKGLRQGIENLDNGGRVVVISYHSLEDRIVKKIFAEAEREKIIKILTKKPIVSDYIEIKQNSRSRSAKLRAAEKI